MILLIKSHKHYSLISSSGAAAGGWELPAAVTEVVLERMGHGQWEGSEGRESVQRQEPHPGYVFFCLLLLFLCYLFGPGFDHGNAPVW